MNKAELAMAIAEKVGLSKKQTEDALEAMTEIITETLKKDGEVTLAGFGSFSSKVRKGRKGINPQTKEAIEIKPTRVAKFKAGFALKKTLKAQGPGTQG